jgi:hypothetical protein
MKILNKTQSGAMGNMIIDGMMGSRHDENNKNNEGEKCRSQVAVGKRGVIVFLQCTQLRGPQKPLSMEQKSAEAMEGGPGCLLTPTPLLMAASLRSRLERGFKWNLCKNGSSDLSGGSGILPIEVGYPVWCMNFHCILPAIVLWPITFSLDFEL